MRTMGAPAPSTVDPWNFYVASKKDRPAHADLLRVARLHRRYATSWWDALILNSARELDAVCYGRKTCPTANAMDL